MKSKKILVVGGTGFIGYHLIKLLLKKKFKVTSISSKKPKKYRKLKNVKYVYFDISKKKNFLKLSNKYFNYAVNLGGYVDHSKKKKTYESHYKGCVNLYNFFKNSNLKSFIQIGSSLEYGGLKSPQKENKIKNKTYSIYSKSKLLATNFLLKKYKLNSFPATIIRGYQVYGPKQDNNRLVATVIINCSKDRSFPCSSGNQKRDFLYVEDFVEAIYKSLKNKKSKGEIFNIGFGKPTRVKALILKIKKIINKGNPVFGTIKLRKDESLILYPSIDKAKKILNWTPKTDLNAGIIKTIKDYNKIYL